MKTSKYILLLIVTFKTYAQNISTLDPEQEKKVDKIFEDAGWKMPHTAGIAFAIIKDGNVVYKKSFGASDIENKIPITSRTRFNLAHTSVHFTAYAMLKLVTEGKISLKDDVRKHLEPLSNFDQKVTLEDLLRSSSGIYDHDVLLGICGWSPTDNFSQNNILKLISLQKNPVFEPGTAYTRSDTNFVLLARLIAKISGKSFKAYMEGDIFIPLGMNDTFVRTNSTSLDDRIAKAYRNQDEKIFGNESRNELSGNNNIFSSIEDLILWEKHLANKNDEHKQIIDLMDTSVTLDDGRTNSTSWGDLTLGQLYGHKERGVFSTYIVGSLGGHDSSIFKFPNQDYVAIALSNDGNGYNGYTGVIAAHNILEQHFTEPETVDFSTIKTKKIHARDLKKHEGFYWDQEGELTREIKVVDDTLRYIRSSENITPLIPLDSGKFQMKMRFDDKVYVNFPKDDPNTMFYEYFGAKPIEFEKYKPITYNAQNFKNKLEGTYYNKEYGVVFKARAAKNGLVLSNAKIGDMVYLPIKPTLFLGDKWFMRSIEFSKDDNENITGFYVRNDAIRNLWFKRI
ncbi:serine hydrolase domain-containing protein [Flagellimonas sp. 2504JD1-5]